MVYEVLQSHEMCTYYDLEANPGIQLKSPKPDQAFSFLDQPEIVDRLLAYRDEKNARVTFFLPQMHCASCIWLLENLYRLKPGIRRSRVEFLKKEIDLTFAPQEVSLREVVQLLASIGYEPDLHLDALRQKPARHNSTAFYFRLGVAGFCFGNIMLMSFPEYLGLDPESEPEFRRFFGYLNLLLALPVFFYSASGFFQSAWTGLKRRYLNIDVPIALGILALFGRSAYEILTDTGAGYMDSLAALIFFLLSGRWFQNRTYDSLNFDRDYTAYFPISATRMHEGQEESVTITQLHPGDTILVRNQELIPADAVLLSGSAQVDYSFVTGEAELVSRRKGDLLYAGGRLAGSAVEMTLVKAVSQSYLTQLWNHDSFQQAPDRGIAAFTDRLGRRFTIAVMSIALLAAGYWLWADSAATAVHVFTSVLIVACPCALALNAPITLGNALRILGRSQFYLKNTQVVERLAEITRIVFDKTGTITHKRGREAVQVEGQLSAEERGLLSLLVRQSGHPVSRTLAAWAGPAAEQMPEGYREIPGQGISARIGGHAVALGNAAFAAGQGCQVADVQGSTYLLIDGQCRAAFRMDAQYRPGLQELLQRLRQRYRLSLISGDHDRERGTLAGWFPEGADLHFEQSPHDKLAYVEALQRNGEVVLMAGDGLNDAGALQMSDAGIAVTEDADAFSPACDGILHGSRLSQLDRLLEFSRDSMRMVRMGLLISLGYNVVGLTIAVQAQLSPVVAAILMPLSSVSVVGFGLLTTWLLGRKMEAAQPAAPSATYK